MSMPSDKAKRRKRVIDLAKEIGVKAACLQGGMDRTTFYKLKKRFDQAGMSGLEDRSSAHDGHPSTIAPKDAKRIKNYYMRHPARGCEWIAKRLGRAKDAGGKLPIASKSTVHAIMANAGLSTRQARWLKIEALRRKKQTREFASERLKFLESQNPNHRDFDYRALRPCGLLFVEAHSIGPFEGIGRVYLHVAIDAYSGYVFARLNSSASTEVLVALVEKTMMPFLKKKGIKIAAVLSPAGSLYCDDADQAFARLLREHSIDHQKRPAETARLGGFAERFRRVVKVEFSKKVAARQTFTNIKPLEAEFFKWRQTYNATPIEGYPNYGEKPLALLTTATKASRAPVPEKQT